MNVLLEVAEQPEADYDSHIFNEEVLSEVINPLVLAQSDEERSKERDVQDIESLKLHREAVDADNHQEFLKFLEEKFPVEFEALLGHNVAIFHAKSVDEDDAALVFKVLYESEADVAEVFPGILRTYPSVRTRVSAGLPVAMC